MEYLSLLYQIEILDFYPDFERVYPKLWALTYSQVQQHPQKDGQSERTIQILEDMLRACVLDF